jgi:hypothetical protein
MSDPSLLARQLERYRKLLFGATDPLLIEGLRKLIAELEAKVTLSPALGDAVPPHGEGEPDLFEPVR